ncbi:MAG: hypothetical protein H6584_06450 [Flavobacteriales bacterium]|nr:hypothetical protein [Flavobacteriales bacterium]
MPYWKYFFLSLTAIILLSCKGYEDDPRFSVKVNQVLRKAGNNRQELVKVLEHFMSTGDSLKYQAAEFIISNMEGHFALDTTDLYMYRAFYKKFDEEYTFYLDHKFQNKINTSWDSLSKLYPPTRLIHQKAKKYDINFVTSQFLINDIDLAVDNWRKNILTRDSVSFKDFCELVLPYRVKSGKVVENWRAKFQVKKKYMTYDIKALCDSILLPYKPYRFNWAIAQGLPLVKAYDLMMIKETQCSNRAWLNQMILASNGIPVATDFVPAWGSREGRHEWNSIVYNGVTYPFEPFWREDIWRNKEIYNNVGIDPKYGKHRVPKVFRETYSNRKKGPISDKRVKIYNIPRLFQDENILDVSSSYFKPVDIQVSIKEPVLDDTYYAYLCVIGEGQKWIPVYWGAIEDQKVTFKDMGTDIVYLPAFYKKGKVIPLGNPFYVNSEGTKREFKVENETQNITVKRKYPMLEIHMDTLAQALVGGVIQGSNKTDFSDAKDLYTIDQKPRLIPQEISFTTEEAFSYYRIWSKKKLQLGELHFYDKKDFLISPTEWMASPQIKSESLQDLNDNNFFTLNEYPIEGKINEPTWIGVQLSEPKKVSKIKYVPRTDTNDVFPDLTYTLVYWDGNTFKTIAKKKATSYELSFKEVPKGALLVLKCNSGKQERFFTYENNHQVWW